MKGFFGAFLVFIVWAVGSIYYLHLKEDKAAATIPVKTEQPKKTANLLDISSGEKSAAELSSSALDSLSFELNDSEEKENQVEGINTERSEDDGNLPSNSALSNAHLLAEEIKKTIAISDTIDIDRDEPEQSPNDVIAVATGPSVSSELFYPQYTNTDLVLDKRLVAYASQLKEIIETQPDKKITIVGHTDNVGNAQDNFKIALKKARQIKWYLTARRGIPRAKVTATSRGEEEPIESNSSNWGRKKNNRIEIIID